ncbi:MAG: InlB B-repeat-containing protein [Clostridia bacterium]|nr:InlB B-repeat-containing protein [Clostridia bacterium]
MKTFVKILSMLVAVIMLISVGVVGMTAYAEPTDVLGNYDFSVVDNPYENIKWVKEDGSINEELHAFKSSTHAHTVRSDADIELNDTIWYHYMKGYEVLCLTDHGTVNGPDIETNGVVTGADGANGAKCGWTEDQSRCTLYGYQSFVHGNIDEITTSDYYDIIAGVSRYDRPQSLVDEGRGMFNLPLGNEANAVSGNKCHVNIYNVSQFHGATRTESWPYDTVYTSWKNGAVSRINHVGEWTDGNSDPSVYDAAWVQQYVDIFTECCPNREGYENDSKWLHENVTGQIVKKGVIGMELVNTSDNRTRNDRFYVYDASLKLLAPLGINMYGFCEDDSHEESDIDKNAQFFLVNDGTAWSEEDEKFTTKQGWVTADNATPWYGYTGDIIRSMTNGEFYCSSVNSKNSYELGDGFNATGDYPSINYFNIDDAESDQITLRVNNASRVRLVADGNIIDTKNISESSEYTEIVFDLNAYEDKINSYVRIYMTGKGGITYLQPILLEKEDRVQSFVQFILPSTDTTLAVYDSTGKEITTKYTDNVYVLEPGNYKYTASRKGYLTKENVEFQVTKAEYDAGTEKIITVTLDKDENAREIFFYAPETIYLDPSDNKTFKYYVDRLNEPYGTLSTSPNKTEGNVYFNCNNASNIKITGSYKEGDAEVYYTLRKDEAANSILATQITSGYLSTSIPVGSYVLIEWKATYTYDNKEYTAYTYSYVYPSPNGVTSTLSAGARNTVDSNLNSPIVVTSSVFAYGLHKIESSQTVGYEYSPYYKETVISDSDPRVSGGSGYYWAEGKWEGSSETVTASSPDLGYIYADRSRINNFKEVPLFRIGFDINVADDADENPSDSGKYPYFSCYFGDTGTVLASMSNERLDEYNGYRAASYDNSAGVALDYSMSMADETRYVLHGEARGAKEIGLPKYIVAPRTVAEVFITVVNVNKDSLRTLYNTAVSNAYQRDWFTSDAEYESYIKNVTEAAKVLGNPAATPDDILTAEKNLGNADKGVQLGTGTAQVKHYWVYGDKTGEILSEQPYQYTMSDVLVANKTDFDGYDYARIYDRKVDGTLVTKNENLNYTGTAEYESVTAAAENYEWIFYYTPESYNISYYTGTENFTPISTSGLKANYGQEFTIATNSPTRTGYTFDGWYLDVDPTQSVYSSGEVITYNYLQHGQLIAKWVPLGYTVSFDLAGGAWQDGDEPTDDEKDVTYDEVYQLPTGVPVKTGYNFLGWKVNGGDTYTAGSQFTWDWAANGTLVAQWSNAEYQITYEPNPEGNEGATVSPTSDKVHYDMPYGTLAVPQRTGYSHQWYTNKNFQDNALVTTETIVKIATNHTLYAKWTPIDYSITYNLVNGYVEGVNPTSYNIKSDSIALINPKRTGYEFIGWSGTDIDVTGYAMKVTIPTGEYGNREYTAHWKVIDYTITYDLDIDESSASKEVYNPNPTSFTYADDITIKPASRAGYEFKGWTGGDFVDCQTIYIEAGREGYADNLTFKAKWELQEYSISYDCGVDGVLGENAPVTYTIENSVKISNPTRTGYTFYGWESDSFDGVKTDYTIEKGTYGNISLSAVWVSDENEVYYELNGADPSTNNYGNPSKYESGTNTITLKEPKKTGYTFVSWDKYTASDKKTVNQKIGTIESTDTGTIFFTARWSANKFTITYDLKGGHYETEVTNNKSEYTFETESFTLTNPIKEGYVFAGWSGTDLGVKTKSVTIESGSIGERSYTANWNVATYTISYDFDGGTPTGSCITTYNFETTDKVIESPSRLGYTFAGWTQHFQNFTWKQGKLDDSGYLVAVPNYYLSSPILVRSGYTYTMNASGTLSDITAFLFDENRVFKKSINVGQQQIFEIPTDDLNGDKYFVYFVVTGDFVQPAYRDTISILAVDNSDENSLRGDNMQMKVSVPQGSTGNFKLTAHWDIETYNLTYDLAGGYFNQYDEEGKILGPNDEGYIVDYNPNPSTYTVNTNDIPLENPVRTGYNFLGWEFNNNTNSNVIIKQGSTGNREYKALWTKSLYSIKYDLGGGSVVGNNPESYAFDTETFRLINPTRTGYSFNGWTGTGINGASDVVEIVEGSTGDRIYTATWTPETYNITYVLGGGVNATVNPNTYTYETETFTLAHPTKVGATFSGWEGTGLESETLNVTIHKGSTDDRVYTAKWSVSKYTISYNLAGGTQETNPPMYTVDTESFTLATPTRTGYKFSGWTGTGLEEPTVLVTIAKGSTGNRNYTATWSPITYNINYYLDGGKVGIANPGTYTIESATFTLNNPVKAGYIFDGWSGTDIKDEDGPTQTVTVYKGSIGNRNYTAHWTLQEYTINYNLNGAKEEDNLNRTSYNYNTPTFTLNEPTRTGYTFEAWSGTGITGTGLAKVVTIPTGSTGNRTYTANWKLTEYTITYNLGSENNGAYVPIKNPDTYNYLSSPITLNNPVRPGYDFKGWVTSEEEGEEPQLTVTIPTNSTDNKYFKAVWEEGNYTITYDLGEGSWPENYTPVEGYTYATDSFTIPQPVKEGYTFAGWSGTGISGTVKELTIYKNSTGDRSYTAHWAEGENVITYNLNGGVLADENPTSYVTGSGEIILNNPTKSGYRFTGWTGSNGTDPQIGVVINTTNGGALSFVANWKAITYKISYVLGGGEVVGEQNPINYTVESDNITLNNPVRTGYTFKGWQGTELDGTQPTVTIAKGSTGNRAYTAIWEETVYKITYNYGEGSVEFANPTTYTFTTPTFTINNPTLAGYTFTGWTGSNGDTAQMTVSVTKGSTGDKEFTANYSINTYALKFLGVDGATFTAPAYEYDVTKSITIPNPTKIGYIFNGWSGTGILGMQKDVVIPVGSTGNRTYTANFTPVDYTIDYDLAGGRVSGINPTGYTVETADLSILNPGRAGFSFDGWTLSIVDFIWYDGTIDANGNVVDGAGHYSMPVSLRAGTTYTYDSSIKLAIFGTDGKFVALANSGSYTADVDCLCSVVVAGEATEAELASVALTVDGKVSTVAIPHGNMGSLKLVANWTSEKFTITYYLNGGTLAVENPKEYTAETESFKLNNPTRTGYIFTGWTGTGLSNTTVDVEIPIGSTGNRIYTANWRIEKYYLTINLDGGTFTQDVPEYFTVDTATFSLPIPVKSGYTFTGWADENGNVQPTVTIQKGSTGARSYTAQWVENTSGTHKFYFYGFNNQLLETQEVEVGEKVTGIDPQIVIGYEFAGWSVDITSADVINSTDDFHVYSTYKVGPDVYDITVNGVTTQYTQYATVKVSADATSSDGKSFLYWAVADENGNATEEIVSYYRSFSFKAHAKTSIVAVYGDELNSDKVAIRITKAEYNAQHNWISFYAERSVDSSYTLLQHGIMFTDKEDVVNGDGTFELGKANVYASTASSTNRSGVYTLSIGGLHYNDAPDYAGCEKLYARAYVKYVDADGNIKTVYSDVVEYANAKSNIK